MARKLKKPKKGAFIPPFPPVPAQSRIYGGGERVTEDDPVRKGGKRPTKNASDGYGQRRPT